MAKHSLLQFVDAAAYKWCNSCQDMQCAAKICNVQVMQVLPGSIGALVFFSLQLSVKPTCRGSDAQRREAAKKFSASSAACLSSRKGADFTTQAPPHTVPGPFSERLVKASLQRFTLCDVRKFRRLRCGIWNLLDELV